MNNMKKCEVCGKMKPISDFSKSYKNRCKECVASMARIRRDSRSEKKAEEYRKLMETPDPIADNLLIDWEQRRYELSKAAMQGYLANVASESINEKSLATLCIIQADEMIRQLKSEKHDEQSIQDP